MLVYSVTGYPVADGIGGKSLGQNVHNENPDWYVTSVETKQPHINDIM